MIKRLEALIEGFNGTVGIVIEDLNGGFRFTYNETEVFPSCSLIKLPILAHFFDAIHKNEINPNEAVPLDQSKMAPGHGLVRLFDIKSQLTYFDHALLMTSISDNTSTNIIIDALGMKNIKEAIKQYGMPSTVLNRKMMDLIAIEQGKDNFTSPSDVATVLKRLNSFDRYDGAIEMLKNQQCNEMIPALFPEGISFAHKTGALPFLKHDAGILFLDHQILVVIMTKNQKKDCDAIALHQNIGKLLLETNWLE